MKTETTHELKDQPVKESPSIRTLKIEAEGDSFRGQIKPKIRLMGHWLERAGFKPGTRVSVRCLGSGVMELRSETESIS